jgi:hypothetical protein
LLFATLAQGAQPGPEIRLRPGPENDPTRATFEVTGLPPTLLESLAARPRAAGEWSALFSVVVVRDDNDARNSRLPVAGKHELAGSSLRFTPRYPLVPGLRYQATFDPGAIAGAGRAARPPIRAQFAVPAQRQGASTRVVRVDPGAETLPENQLKFYVHFSAPMRRGEAYRHIRLDELERGPVDMPFLELGEELWDTSARRLTLLLDPGRIKRGLKPREEAGPILVEGRRYRLTIDDAWPDAQGYPLEAEFAKEFRAAAPDGRAPDPATWRVAAPPAGSRRPLAIVFGEALDRPMLDRALAVRGPEGRFVAGEHDVPDDATSWRFTPDAAWTEGAYRLVIDASLEDLAGNSIGRPFEVDAERPIEKAVSEAAHELKFHVGPAQPPESGPGAQNGR